MKSDEKKPRGLYECEHGCCHSGLRPIRCFNPKRKTPPAGATDGGVLRVPGVAVAKAYAEGVREAATAAVTKAVTKAVKRAAGDELYVELRDGSRLSESEVRELIKATVLTMGLDVVRGGLKDALIAQLNAIVDQDQGKKKGRRA